MKAEVHVYSDESSAVSFFSLLFNLMGFFISKISIVLKLFIQQQFIRIYVKYFEII